MHIPYSDQNIFQKVNKHSYRTTLYPNNSRKQHYFRKVILHYSCVTEQFIQQTKTF